MKKILITGANSYIGSYFERWLNKWPNQYIVDTVDMMDGKWKERKFSEFDVVFHVAGIAHCRENKKNQQIFYSINRDLAYDTAKKAKEEGIKQFIYLSSMSVYGVSEGIINEETIPEPKNCYGKSKYQAEQLIDSLKDDCFKTTIVRPPIIYGKGCKGNYPKLRDISLKIPFFPDIENHRSMIFIDNLCEILRFLIDNCSDGLFFPQNEEYVCTSELVKTIAETNGKKIHMIKIFNPFIHRLKFNIVKKVFGDLVYEKSMSEFHLPTSEIDFRHTINLTEKR